MLTQQEIEIESTSNKQVVDITDILNDLLHKNQVSVGSCILFTTHSSCALTTANLDPGTDQDMIDAFAQMFPKLNYRHEHDPSHVGDHIMSSLIGASVFVPVHNANFVLGPFQRVVLIEFSGPRRRKIIVSYIPS